MNEEKDIIQMEDESGQLVDLYVMGYLNYEGKDYAMLCETEDGTGESYVMEIVPIPGDDENEEFAPIDDDLANEILKVYKSVSQMDDE